LQSALHPLLNSFAVNDANTPGPPTAAAVAKLFGRQGVTNSEVVDVFSYLLGAEGVNQAAGVESPEIMREKARWAVRNAIQVICLQGPLLLMVEDIHWLDPTSRQLLIEIGEIIQTIPALLVMTTRNSAAATWLPADITDIKLRPLDREETRQAITAMWPESKSSDTPEFVEVLTRVTGGVPLLIEEMCQWMSENLGSAADRLVKTTSPSRASIFESILEARLESLGPAREVAHAASVVGSKFDQRVLGALLPEFDTDTISQALEALSEAGFLTRIRPSSLPAYGYRHSLIQETIYNALLRKSRQTFHLRLFVAANQDTDIAPWIGTAALAEQAERAGMVESAIELFVKAGSNSYARSAMVEARHLLERALELCERIGEPGKNDSLRLTAMAALGPILTATEGPNSAPARKLYEDAVEIARRRPSAERAKWFPIYWGWWFTDTVMDGERAHALLRDLKDVEDAEVQLQARHCVWAIDFYLGRHESCIAAVDAGLSLYGSGSGHDKITLFGGHDARVCGLSHRGLSLWFTGRAASAVQSLSEAKHWARQTGHIGSIGHAYNNEAMLHCYRRDMSSLRNVIADIRRLTETHHLPSLAATATILEGWCEGNAGRFKRGRDMVREGLAIHGELQTPEDYPVYCGMLAELLAQTGDINEALDLLSSAAAQAEQAGHHYWLAELHHRRARLLYQQGATEREVLRSLTESLAIASEQNAVPILLGAYEMLLSVDPLGDIASRYRARFKSAKDAVEPGQDLIVNPERIPHRQSPT
jgi:predicted ATPase